MEANGHTRWLESVLKDLRFELRIRRAARSDEACLKAEERIGTTKLIVKLLLKDRYRRVWVPSKENRDLLHCSGAGTA
jgi:hypothetical protein